MSPESPKLSCLSNPCGGGGTQFGQVYSCPQGGESQLGENDQEVILNIVASLPQSLSLPSRQAPQLRGQDVYQWDCDEPAVKTPVGELRALKACGSYVRTRELCPGLKANLDGMSKPGSHTYLSQLGGYVKAKEQCQSMVSWNGNWELCRWGGGGAVRNWEPCQKRNLGASSEIGSCVVPVSKETAVPQKSLRLSSRAQIGIFGRLPKHRKVTQDSGNEFWRGGRHTLNFVSWVGPPLQALLNPLLNEYTLNIGPNSVPTENTIKFISVTAHDLTGDFQSSRLCHLF